MARELCRLLVEANAGNEDAVFEIFNRFKGKIKIMSQNTRGIDSCTTQDIESILKLTLMSLIADTNMDIYKNTSDSKLVAYIISALNYELNSLLSIKYKQGKYLEENQKVAEELCSEDDYAQLAYSDMLDKLTPLQRKIIIGIYIDKYRINELAEMYHMSRQSIYTNRKKAIEIIKANVDEKNL